MGLGETGDILRAVGGRHLETLDVLSQGQGGGGEQRGKRRLKIRRGRRKSRTFLNQNPVHGQKLTQYFCIFSNST